MIHKRIVNFFWSQHRRVPRALVRVLSRPTYKRPEWFSVTVGADSFRVTRGYVLWFKRLLSRLLSDVSVLSAYRLTVSYRHMTASVTSLLLLCVLLTAVQVWQGTVQQEAFAAPDVTLADTTPEFLGTVGEQLSSEFEAFFFQAHPEILSDANMEVRTHLIAQYLSEKKSPLVPYADVIAAQPHWKEILAISYPESGFGKRCYEHNCSGIGSNPGSPNWHSYENFAEWIVDLNKLLERRYKDQTFEQMCGVYKKPCTKQWLDATESVARTLEIRGVPN